MIMQLTGLERQVYECVYITAVLVLCLMVIWVKCCGGRFPVCARLS